MPLFTRESHLQFPEIVHPPTDDARDLAAQFGLSADFDEVTQIHKRAENSRLYVLRSHAGGKLVLRRFAVEDARLVERQCEAILESGFRATIRPCRTTAGALVARTRASAGILYPYREGQIYSGDPDLLGSAIETGVALLEALRPCVLELPRPRHVPEAWIPLLTAVLRDGTLHCPLFAAHIAPDAAEHSVRALLRLQGAIERAADLWRAGTPVVVHNDLNHANLLQESNTFCVLDIEDIMREVPRISLAHGIFKLARHVVFADPARASRVTTQLRTSIVPELIAAGWIGSPEELRLFSLFRILSDVHGIIRDALDRQDPRYLYDLQKRMDNALESEILLGGELH